MRARVTGIHRMDHRTKGQPGRSYLQVELEWDDPEMVGLPDVARLVIPLLPLDGVTLWVGQEIAVDLTPVVGR